MVKTSGCKLMTVLFHKISNEFYILKIYLPKLIVCVCLLFLGDLYYTICSRLSSQVYNINTKAADSRSETGGYEHFNSTTYFVR